MANNTTLQQYERIGPKCVSVSNVARREVCPLQVGPKRSTTLIVSTITGSDPYPVQYGLHCENQQCTILRHQIVVVTTLFLTLAPNLCILSMELRVSFWSQEFRGCY